MSEYYQYRDIVVRFDVFQDGDDVIPTGASVLIYDTDHKYLGEDTATIEGSEVRYVLDGKNVEEIGEYAFVFNVNIGGLGDYTHIVRVNAQELPVPVSDEFDGDINEVTPAL